MRISRIYHPGSLSRNSEIELASQAATHLARVLRCKKGDELILFNGNGFEYPALITRLHRNQVWVTVQSENSVNRESPLTITLAQAISKGERMDYTIQKAVELGVSKIIPVTTERSANIKPDRIRKKQHHWQNIASSACEQCGRNVVPEIGATMSLAQLLANCDKNAINLILDPATNNNINAIHYSHENIILLIGPEGGLSANEISLCQQHGFTGVSMGPRILRTETAAITALSAIQFHWGDLS